LIIVLEQAYSASAGRASKKNAKTRGIVLTGSPARHVEKLTAGRSRRRSRAPACRWRDSSCSRSKSAGSRIVAEWRIQLNDALRDVVKQQPQEVGDTLANTTSPVPPNLG
jgi:hypothetical protein